LHLVGYLYYWQMEFNSVFKGLSIKIILYRNIIINKIRIITKRITISEHSLKTVNSKFHGI